MVSDKLADQPDLSVVIPYFNHPEQLDAVLADLLRQRGIAFEVIVVDDASQEDCGAVIARYRRLGLKALLLRQPKRSYTLAGRLRGMRHARGRWLAFMDADDGLAAPDAYARAVAQAQAAGCDILHFLTIAQAPDGACEKWEPAAPFWDSPLQGIDIVKTWLASDCRAHSVWNKLYSRALYAKIAALPHDIPIFRIEDFYLTAHFLFFARSWMPAAIEVYRYLRPAGTHLLKSAGRAFDAMRMYQVLPPRFAGFGMPPELCRQLLEYIRKLVVINSGRMCGFIAENMALENGFDLDFSSPAMRGLLEYGTKRDLFLALAIANGRNARKLQDIYGLVNDLYRLASFDAARGE